jgi:hypothetical protein
MMGDVKCPPKINDKDLAQRFFKVVSKNNPILLADCDWQTWDSTKDKQNPLGKVLLAGMLKHPKIVKDGKEEYNHILHNAAGEECFAKLKVVKWVGKPTKAAPAPTPAPAPVAVKAEPVLEDTGDITFGDDGEISL